MPAATCCVWWSATTIQYYCVVLPCLALRILPLKLEDLLRGVTRSPQQPSAFPLLVVLRRRPCHRRHHGWWTANEDHRALIGSRRHVFLDVICVEVACAPVLQHRQQQLQHPTIHHPVYTSEWRYTRAREVCNRGQACCSHEQLIYCACCGSPTTAPRSCLRSRPL